MSITFKKAAVALLAITLTAGTLSCGSSTNNDQGTSFLATGWFFVDDQGEVQLNQGETGRTMVLSSDIGEIDANYAITAIGLLNRMTAQYIRVVRIDCSYEVPGTTLSIPDDSFASSVVIAPSPAANPDDADPQVGFPTTGGGASNVPGQGNIQVMGFQILSPDVIAYLTANQNYLPQLPYRLVVTCSAVGVTQAGDTITTNPLNYFIQFVEVSECCTGTPPGFQNGPGTGGTVPYTGGVGGDGGTGEAVVEDEAVLEE